jgi:hypothetical protein
MDTKDLTIREIIIEQALKKVLTGSLDDLIKNVREWRRALCLPVKRSKK